MSEPTKSIQRKKGASPVHHVSAGQSEFEFTGDGPWQMPATTWAGLRDAASEWFEESPAPAPAPEKARAGQAKSAP